MTDESMSIFSQVPKILSIGLKMSGSEQTHTQHTEGILQTHYFDFRALRKASFQWNMTGASSSLCRKARAQFGLVRRQTKLCRTTTQAMPHIVKAATQAVATCQSVFADRRWNCTSIETAPSFTPDITTGNFLRRYSFHKNRKLPPSAKLP